MGRRISLILITCSVIVLQPASAFAADKTPLKLPATDSSQHSTNIDGTGMMLKTLAALLVVVGVIFAIYKGLKIINKGAGNHQPAASVKVMSRTQLDRDLSLYVVRMGDHAAVMARSGSHIELLRWLSEEEAGELALDQIVPPSAQGLIGPIKDLAAKARQWKRPEKKADTGRAEDVPQASAEAPRAAPQAQKAQAEPAATIVTQTQTARPEPITIDSQAEERALVELEMLAGVRAPECLSGDAQPLEIEEVGDGPEIGADGPERIPSESKSEPELDSGFTSQGPASSRKADSKRSLDEPPAQPALQRKESEPDRADKFAELIAAAREQIKTQDEASK